MKELNGKELAGFIKERQAKAVRQLRSQNVQPKLAIVMANEDPVITSYVKMKRRYGADIGVEVDIINIHQSELKQKIDELNDDTNTHAIIVQLPLEDPSQTDDLLSEVAPSKDVDGLGPAPDYDPATATAILWLLAGYNVELRGKRIAIIGLGRLVGFPLARMLEGGGHELVEIDKNTEHPAKKASECDIIITATGVARLVTNEWVKQGAVIVDAGTAGEKGKIVGDVADEVRQRQDLAAITPLKGGVGPLTVCALFENTISAARTELQ